MNSGFFSLSRWLGIVGKEFIQLKRDRLTFAMIVGIPVVQLVMFGYAINSDPKRLPTALLIADRSEFSRSILAGLQNSRYFEFVGEAHNEDDADRMLAMGEAHRTHGDDQLGGHHHPQCVECLVRAPCGDRGEARVRFHAARDRDRLGGDRGDERAHLGDGRVGGVLEHERP